MKRSRFFALAFAAPLAAVACYAVGKDGTCATKETNAAPKSTAPSVATRTNAERAANLERRIERLTVEVEEWVKRHPK